jgi:hypothetical protein
MQGILRTEPGSGYRTCITNSDCGIPGLICLDGWCVTPLDQYFEYTDWFLGETIYHKFEYCPTANMPYPTAHFAQYSYWSEITSCHGNGNQHCIPMLEETTHNLDWAESLYCSCGNVSQ